MLCMTTPSTISSRAIEKLTEHGSLLYRAWRSVSRLKYFSRVYVRGCPCGGDIWYHARRASTILSASEFGCRCNKCGEQFVDNVAFWSEEQLARIYEARK